MKKYHESKRPTVFSNDNHTSKLLLFLVDPSLILLQKIFEFHHQGRTLDNHSRWWGNGFNNLTTGKARQKTRDYHNVIDDNNYLKYVKEFDESI